MRPAPRTLRLLAVGLVAALAAPLAHGQSRAETAYDLVRLDLSARTAALAGAGALPDDDPAAALANPALLVPDMDRAVSVGYANLVGDVNAGSAAYARTVPRWGLTVGAAVRHLSYGEFERRLGADTGADAVGTFGAGETALTLVASRALVPRVRVGVAAHALAASLDGDVSAALTGDLGLSYHAPAEGWVLGASVHHVGARLASLGTDADRLPLDVRLTVSKRLRYVPLTVSASGVDLHRFEGPNTGTDSSAFVRALDHVALGGELALGSVVSVRAGYNGRRGGDLRSGGRLDLAGLSVGAGVRLRRVSVDYAFSNWGAFGGLHQFGLRTRL